MRAVYAGRVKRVIVIGAGPMGIEAAILGVARGFDVTVLGQRVVSVGRARMRRDEYAGHPLRAERPFRVLTASAAGERVLEADVVLDASGVYGQPTAMGAGGVPAPGERALGARIIRHLGELQ